MQGSRRFLGVTIPPLKHFGPLLVVWGGAMVMLVFIRDLGSSLMFFGGFLALLYVATNRLSFVDDRARPVRARRVVLRQHRRPRAEPHRHLARPVRPRRSTTMEGGSYQIAQSLFAQADGGLFGTGFGQALIAQPDGDVDPARAADRPDLRGDHERARAGRRVRAAARLPDGRRARLQDRDARRRTRSPSCSPPGLTAVFALQVFVIVGGVTKVIPLTGVTLPFVSYGGSSIVANFVLLALLLLISDRAAAARPRAMNQPVLRLFGLVVRAVRRARRVHVALDGVRGRGAARQRAQPARAAAGAEDPPRHDPLGRRQGARARGAAAGRARSAAATRPASCSPTRSATRTRRSAAPASSARATTS